MRNSGIIRQLDEMGRLVLPKEMRRALDLKEKDPVSFFIEGDMIYLKKHLPGCVFCGEINDTIPYKNKLVCPDCLKGIKKFVD